MCVLGAQLGGGVGVTQTSCLDLNNVNLNDVSPNRHLSGKLGKHVMYITVLACVRGNCHLTSCTGL